MIVKKGNYSVVGDEKDIKDKPEVMKDIPKSQDSDTDSVKKQRSVEDIEDVKTKAKEFKGGKPSKIATNKPKKPNWDTLSSQALSRNSSSLSDTSKRILRSIKTKEPVVDWKKELKKFFDQSFKSTEWILPNKRFISSGNVLYGRKNVGDDTLKTIVAAVDTSSSISKEQIKVFVNEVMKLCKTFDADKTIIIYCSDYIDNVDIVKKGGEPDFNKIASTGGNKSGFIPPFKWVEDNKIKPSIFIYLTDTGGTMPDPNKYGIKKYIKKVIWFICSPEVYNTPPFGKILFAPVSAIKT